MATIDYNYTFGFSSDAPSSNESWWERTWVDWRTCPVCGMEYDALSGPCPVEHSPQMLETHTGNTTHIGRVVLGDYESTVRNVFLNGKAQDLPEYDEEEEMEKFITLLAARGKLDEAQLLKLREIMGECDWDKRFVLLLLAERLAQGVISYEMLGYKQEEE